LRKLLRELKRFLADQTVCRTHQRFGNIGCGHQHVRAEQVDLNVAAPQQHCPTFRESLQRQLDVRTRNVLVRLRISDQVQNVRTTVLSVRKNTFVVAKLHL
jgi:hypothetical protein